MNITNKRQHGCGSLDCGDGTRVDIHMANNAGRGCNNVTLTRVAATVTRPAYTRHYDEGEIIAQTQTSAWCGNWSLSTRVRRDLDLGLL